METKGNIDKQKKPPNRKRKIIYIESRDKDSNILNKVAPFSDDHHHRIIFKIITGVTDITLKAYHRNCYQKLMNDCLGRSKGIL